MEQKEIRQCLNIYILYQREVLNKTGPNKTRKTKMTPLLPILNYDPRPTGGASCIGIDSIGRLQEDMDFTNRYIMALCCRYRRLDNHSFVVTPNAKKDA